MNKIPIPRINRNTFKPHLPIPRINRNTFKPHLPKPVPIFRKRPNATNHKLGDDFKNIKQTFKDGGIIILIIFIMDEFKNKIIN